MSIDRWIHTNERLPDGSYDVLVTDGCDKFVAYYDLQGSWRSYDSRFDKYTPIKYWRPLPEEPKGEFGND